MDVQRTSMNRSLWLSVPFFHPSIMKAISQYYLADTSSNLAQTSTRTERWTNLILAVEVQRSKSVWPLIHALSTLHHRNAWREFHHHHHLARVWCMYTAMQELWLIFCQCMSVTTLYLMLVCAPASTCLDLQYGPSPDINIAQSEQYRLADNTKPISSHTVG